MADVLNNIQFRRLLLLVVILLTVGTVFYSNVEGWGYLDSLYFCVTTLTTVGYGDLNPQTDLGKIFTIFYILVGVGILLGFINAVMHHAYRKIL